MYTQYRLTDTTPCLQCTHNVALFFLRTAQLKCTKFQLTASNYLTLTAIHNRRSSEIQGTAIGKCLQAWPVYIGPGLRV